jgi:hypothetical protein
VAGSGSFSPDGSRILTGSRDGTARVWDARTRTSLFEWKGQADVAGSGSFSPDGSRVVIGGEDGTAKVWDARTGAPLLELRGHRGSVWSAWFSPDGRFIALMVRNRVEVISLQPDAEELSYRLLHGQPMDGRYREEYDAARAANDAFAVEFYLSLLPPPKRTRLRAEAIVEPLFARLLLRDDVLAAIQFRPSADSEIQAACLELVGTWPESAEECNRVAWPLVRDPGQMDANYQRGLRLAKGACRLQPENAAILNTLGVAQYRCGLMAEALETLTRTNTLNKEKEPSDLAFLALVHHRLGQSDKARDTLARLRQVMKDLQQAENQESQAFLREAETIELDRVFPADPFAP